MIKDKIELVHQNHDIFADSHLPFPDFLTGTAGPVQPRQGLIDIDPVQPGPASISIELAVSLGRLLQLSESTSLLDTSAPENWQPEPAMATNV